jgi:hypothetical protein
LFHHDELSWRYGGLAFRYRAPEKFGSFLQVTLRRAGKPDDAFPLVLVRPRHTALVEGWNEVLIDWKELNPGREPFDRVLIGARSQVDSDQVELDKVMLTVPPPSDTQKASLRVMCSGKSHPISELIYGAASDEWSSGQSAQRIGGNPLTRDNWEIGAWNTGNDWFFENVGQDSTVFDTIERAASQRHKLALVVPLIGWVAKDKTSVGFPREKFGAQRKHDPYKPEAGDGYRPDGTPIRPGDPTQTSIAAPPELIGAWVRKLVGLEEKRGFRSVQMYILDNEPALWDVTHRDVHPDPVTYDELLDRTVKYASEIRQADPAAVIAGPAEWGYTGYEYSGADRAAGFGMKPDRRAHGDVPIVAWYLRQLAERERKTGQRLLDVFDLHFYPAADGIYGGNARTDASSAALRLRSTRSLWDPEYRDESWIKDNLQLIPRMQKWVAENYAGTKTSIGEWNFGAEEHISGGLATAEALGRFGQQGLDAAFHWGTLKPGTPTYWAFRAFRNFDGAGGRFLDFSVSTQELEHLSLFASRDADTKRLVLVLVNRDATTRVQARIVLTDCGQAQSARAFTYGADSKGFGDLASTVQGAEVSAELEPFSISVLDLAVRAP